MPLERLAVNADLAADILLLMRANPGATWTIRQIWARLDHQRPLAAVNACLKVLTGAGHLTCERKRSGADRVRVFSLSPTAADV